ncbi:3-mercaptopyruvate sulfurtransferase [Asticcacaulis tiandongensis]|uniref:3-mercaptopyruvate sulfurtransferase n=1 Tax=Asticcacaulis tiandongensis TaxID=2565365 RepID=UPI00112DF231|nr:3-mercaptopyruvate sulfurtransferase [Asticcacaulis tiandongensis]
MKAQISVSELSPLIDEGKVKILDGSWALDGTDMQALYRASHIPTAQFFDLEAISDRQSSLPHMAPPPEVFAGAVSQMGIAPTDHVVIYDRQGLFSAARVWWTFRLMGHETVQVLRGGVPAWQAAGLPVSSDMLPKQPASYPTPQVNNLSININDLKDILKSNTSAILDARPLARFKGEAPEPRAGLRSGHIPESLSLPFSALLHDGALKPENELKTLFSALGLNKDTPVITTCGSGITAAIIALALFEAGYDKVRLYDGSWAEWGQEGLDTPVATAASSLS